MTDTDRERPAQPAAPAPGGAPEKVIAPDEAFGRMVDDNAMRAWRKYCEENGLDPDAEEATP